jgi:hypothetical protein
MPIEIKITDIKSLTIEEIDQLHSYLISTHTAKQIDHSTTEPKTAYETNLPENTTLLKTASKKKHKPIEEQTTTRNDSFTPEEKAEVLPLENAPQTEVVELSAAEVFAPPPPYPNILSVGAVEDPTEARDELVAYVLEATRMKKLTFDQVMQVLAKYCETNLNGLDKYPHLIAPIRAAFEEIVK